MHEQSQSGVSFLKHLPKIPAASCLFSEEKEKRKDEREGGLKGQIAGKGADVKRKSKVTVCLACYLNDLRYHVRPDAELGLILR